MLGIFFFYLLVRIPNVAEWYGRNLYPNIASVLSGFSNLFNISLYDIGLTAFVLAIPVTFILACFQLIKWQNALYYFVISIVTVVVWFYGVWGINYFRPDFYTRSGVHEVKFDSTAFKNFASSYINSLNASYCTVDQLDFNHVDSLIEASYSKLHESLNISYPCGKRKAKKMIYQSWFTKAGIAGYYGPFFSEIHVNLYPLAVDLPFTLAHEKAHQFGVTNESECNLYAYIVCTSSDDPIVRYSGYLGALGYVINNMMTLIPDDYKAFVSKIAHGVIDDYNKSVTHWQDGINQNVSDAHSKAYDTYLKGNNVKSGIQSYSEMIALLVSWNTKLNRQ